MEFCARGSLLSFLRAKRLDTVSPLSSHQLAGMAVQVAMGMEYLGLKNVCYGKNINVFVVLKGKTTEVIAMFWSLAVL